MQERNIALNYIYLSEKHAGGKDQEGINILKGINRLGISNRFYVICYDYSVDTVKAVAPDVELLIIPFGKNTNELGRLIKLLKNNTFVIPKLVKRYKISLVHHLSCNTGLVRLKCKSTVTPQDIKAVAHPVLANVRIPLYKQLIYKLMYYLDFSTNDGIVAISDVDKKEIGTFYPRFADKVKRIYVPVDIVPPKEMTKVKENHICALNLQFHHKNIITLIKAFELIKDGIDSDLYLIGSIPKRVSYLREYVENHKLEDRIHFTGFVSDEERDELFHKCRLYVNPTLYEGFGMTAVEAIIYGVPTLVSNIPTNYEVTQGLAWYYSPPEDEHVLAEEIKKALSSTWNDPEKKSIQLLESYECKTIAKEYLEYFDKLIN